MKRRRSRLEKLDTLESLNYAWGLGVLAGLGTDSELDKNFRFRISSRVFMKQYRHGLRFGHRLAADSDIPSTSIRAR